MSWPYRWFIALSALTLAAGGALAFHTLFASLALPAWADVTARAVTYFAWGAQFGRPNAQVLSVREIER